jgi:hypothetical protein
LDRIDKLDEFKVCWHKSPDPGGLSRAEDRMTGREVGQLTPEATESMAGGADHWRG